MLTADLVRMRDNGKTVAPRYLVLDEKRRPAMLARAEGLIGLFTDNEGKRSADLDEAISDLVGDGTDHMLTKGLTKDRLQSLSRHLRTRADATAKRRMERKGEKGS